MKFYSKRKRNIRKLCHVLLIICEGETEENYFQNYNKREYRNITIKTPNTNDTDPKNLVKYAKSMNKKYNPDITWCIFDTNSCTQKEIDKAYKNAGSNVSIICTNPCFELWFLLHYCAITNPLTKEDTIKFLKKHISDYKKPNDIFPIIYPFTDKALNNAKKLNKMHISNGLDLKCLKCNPSTQVFQIVEYITNIISKL